MSSITSCGSCGTGMISDAYTTATVGAAHPATGETPGHPQQWPEQTPHRANLKNHSLAGHPAAPKSPTCPHIPTLVQRTDPTAASDLGDMPATTTPSSSEPMPEPIMTPQVPAPWAHTPPPVTSPDLAPASSPLPPPQHPAPLLPRATMPFVPPAPAPAPAPSPAPSRPPLPPATHPRPDPGANKPAHGGHHSMHHDAHLLVCAGKNQKPGECPCLLF